jgi:hypothetical protein
MIRITWVNGDAVTHVVRSLDGTYPLRNRSSVVKTIDSFVINFRRQTGRLHCTIAKRSQVVMRRHSWLLVQRK